MRFIIYKPNETLEVLLLPHKESHLYSFINLTKGHICGCQFKSPSDALENLNNRKSAGLILDYNILD